MQAAVRPRVACAGVSSILYQKRSGFEAKTLCMALKGVKSLLQEVELVAKLPISKQKWTSKTCETACVDQDQKMLFE